MELDAKERRMVVHCLRVVLRQNQDKLAALHNEDSDEYLELSNDTMIIDSLIAKLGGDSDCSTTAHRE